MNGKASKNSAEKQAAALEQFKTAVGDLLKPDDDDDYCSRWLRARNHDPVKAETMYRASMKWRRQMDADNLVTNYEPPEVLTKYFPFGICGFDKTGCPIFVICYGNCDSKGLLHSVKKSDYYKHAIYCVEKGVQVMKEQSKKHGRNIDQLCVIFDLENFGMKHITWKPAVDMMIQLVSAHEANYPEMLKKVYVVNTPKVFSIAYAIVRPFINDITASKIKIFGRDKWRDALLNDIDSSEFPVHWGGSKTDDNGDPRCPNLICLGGDVPQSYYMAPANRLSECEDLQQTIVNKGSTFKIEKEITISGSAIRWEFKTEEYDIGFGIYKKTEKSNELVMPIQRVNSQLVPEDGQFVCEDPGTYIICFDNTFSVFRPKKLCYTVTILDPDEVKAGYDNIFVSGRKMSSATDSPMRNINGLN